MKTLGAVKIMDISRILIPLVMLAAIAMLAIRFIRMYMKVCIDYLIIYTGPLFMCAEARKRVVNRIAHECKDAVFRENPDSRAGLSGK